MRSCSGRPPTRRHGRGGRQLCGLCRNQDAEFVDKSLTKHTQAVRLRTEPFPHDRINHLEPLPRHGFQRLAVRHAPVAAARVIFAPSVAAARKAVAREYEQVLQPLVALPRRGHRRYRRAGPPVARRGPAARGEPVAAREVGYVYGHGQLGCRARSYAGHRERAPARLVGGKQRGYLGGQRLYLGGVLRYLFMSSRQ